MNTRELKQLLKVLQEARVTKYCTPELTLELETAPIQETVVSAASSLVDEPELTPEELLFYSAPASETQES